MLLRSVRLPFSLAEKLHLIMLRTFTSCFDQISGYFGDNTGILAECTEGNGMKIV